MLPPEGVLLPQLDDRLVETFGIVCASSPTTLLDRYPEVGGAALRALLQSIPLDQLCRTSKGLHVDISLCDNKADIIQSLLDAGKAMDRGKWTHSHSQTRITDNLATRVFVSFQPTRPPRVFCVDIFGVEFCRVLLGRDWEKTDCKALGKLMPCCVPHLFFFGSQSTRSILKVTLVLVRPTYRGQFIQLL